MKKKLIIFITIIFMSLIIINNKNYAWCPEGGIVLETEVVQTISPIREPYKNECFSSTKRLSKSDYPNTINGYIIFDQYSREGCHTGTAGFMFERENLNYKLGLIVTNKELNTYEPKANINSFNPFSNVFNVVDGFSISAFKYFYLAIEVNNDTWGEEEYKDYSLNLNNYSLKIWSGDEIEYNCNKIIEMPNDKLFNVNDYKLFFDYILSYPGETGFEIYEDNYTENYNVVGDHTVKMTLYDYGDDTDMSYTFTIRVVNKMAPKIIVTEANMTINVDTPLSLDDIKSKFTATDIEDGEITDKIVYDTNYDPNNLKPGNYSLSASVIDSDKNQTIVNVVINVVDITKPNIYTDSIEAYTNQLYTKDDIISKISAIDNCSETLNYDVDMTNYEESYSIVGDYTITVNVTDEYNNTQTKDINITVLDKTPPVVIITNITTTRAKKLSQDTIKRFIEVKEDSPYTITITSDNYDMNYDKRGEYEIIITVVDSSDNTTTEKMKITVLSNESPIIYYDNKLIVDGESILNQTQVIELLRNLSGNVYTGVSVVESDYFKTPSVVGEYSALMTTTNSDGSEIKENFTISVEITTKKKKKKSFWKIIINFFKRIFKAIARFFKKLFRLIFK